MELKSQIKCKGKVWKDLAKGLGYVNKPKFFDTLWGVFKLCISIGILYDKQISDEDLLEAQNEDDDAEMEIGRQIFNRDAAQIQLFFQAAILTSNCIHMNEKDRLYLAFIEDIPKEELSDEDVIQMRKGVSEDALSFNKIKFLKQFANYGATKLSECIESHDLATMDNLIEFLNASYNGETEELQKMYEITDAYDDEDTEEL